VILYGVLIGLLLGLLFGGRLDALISVRLRFVLLLLFALLVRYGTQIAIASGVPFVDSLRLPLYAIAFAPLVAALWLNRSLPGLLVVMGGVAANGIVILVNGGFMPVYLPALAAAGLTTADLSPTFNVALPTSLDLQFLLHAGPLGDIIPFPVPPLINVVSLGDVLMTIGLGWFVFATLLRGNPSLKPAGVVLWRGEEAEEGQDRVDPEGEFGLPIDESLGDLDGIDGRRLASTVARAVVAAAAVAGVTWTIARGIGSAGTSEAILTTVLGVVAGATGYFGLLMLFRVDELRILATLLPRTHAPRTRV